MKVYLIRDMNRGDIDSIYLKEEMAEIMLIQLKGMNEKVYKNRYNWKIEPWDVVI